MGATLPMCAVTRATVGAFMDSKGWVVWEGKGGMADGHENKWESATERGGEVEGPARM